MEQADLVFVRKCLEAGLVRSPCLELGVGYGGPTCKELIERAHLSYYGTDVAADRRVDWIVDFEDPAAVVQRAVEGQTFGTVLVLNVLEHTFNPIAVLDNVTRLLNRGGTCIIITPAVWTLHKYPMDCWRINPNFYEEYCRRRSLVLNGDYFEYLGYHNVRKTIDDSGNYTLPRPSASRMSRLRSRIVHKLFNTFGRGMCFPSHVAIGVVIETPTAGGPCGA